MGRHYDAKQLLRNLDPDTECIFLSRPECFLLVRRVVDAFNEVDSDENHYFTYEHPERNASMESDCLDQWDEEGGLDHFQERSRRIEEHIRGVSSRPNDDYRHAQLLLIRRFEPVREVVRERAQRCGYTLTDDDEFVLVFVVCGVADIIHRIAEPIISEYREAN